MNFKNLMLTLSLLAGITLYTSPAFALVSGNFIDEVDFDQDGIKNSISFELFPDQYINVGNGGYSWSHDITNHLGGHALKDVAINSATLNVAYTRTSGLIFTRENWVVSTLSIDLGSLDSHYGFFDPLDFIAVDDKTFQLTDANIIASLNENGLLTINVRETTPGSDSFRLWNSTLSGQYTVNPEPGTIGLMGLGLGLGLLAIRRKKK